MDGTQKTYLRWASKSQSFSHRNKLKRQCVCSLQQNSSFYTWNSIPLFGINYFFFAWHPPKTKLDYTNQIVQLFLNLHPFSIFFADPRSGFDPVQSPQNPLWRESPEETEMHLGCSIRKILCPLWRLPKWQSVVRAEKMGLSPIYCNHSC